MCVSMSVCVSVVTWETHSEAVLVTGEVASAVISVPTASGAVRAVKIPVALYGECDRQTAKTDTTV